MYLVDATLTADKVLRAYRHDEPLLFLGAAFITIGVLSAALCVVRRRFDPLLVFLAMFAYLYGQRLRLQSEILGLGVAHGEAFFRLRAAINYAVPIPAFAFFEAAGFLGRRGKPIVIGLSTIFVALVVGTLIFGALPVFQTTNSLVVLVAVPAVVVRSYWLPERRRDSIAVQIGLFCFVATSIWDNLVSEFIVQSPRAEPYGFAVLLAALGYVAGRNLVRREQAFNDIERELELAQRIQLSILPPPFPENTRFRVAARFVPMTSVAGDLYDFHIESEAKTGLLIADVSGHGVPAALIASMVKMAATAQRSSGHDPAALLAGMNAALCGNTQNQFVTAAYVYLDGERSELRYAAAGHPAMLLLRAGLVSEVIENGLMLAMTLDAEYASLRLALKAADRLVLYTDGLVEARDASGAMFGDEALQRLVAATAAGPAAEAADSIITAVRAWAVAQEDDLTVVVCDYMGAQ